MNTGIHWTQGGVDTSGCSTLAHDDLLNFILCNCVIIYCYAAMLYPNSTTYLCEYWNSLVVLILCSNLAHDDLFVLCICVQNALSNAMLQCCIPTVLLTFVDCDAIRLTVK